LRSSRIEHRESEESMRLVFASSAIQTNMVKLSLKRCNGCGKFVLSVQQSLDLRARFPLVNWV
jgi:hypothetical protein